MADDDDLPTGASRLADDYPEVWAAYQALGRACSTAGPLDDRTKRLLKLALAVGGRSEGAVHSHARRALAEGFSAEEVLQVAALAVPTLGLPQAVAAFTWIKDVVDGRR